MLLRRLHNKPGPGPYLFFSVLLLWLNAAAAETPQRVVSINLCTDQLLLLLAPREHIASVSFMSVNPLYSAYHERVGDIALNHARIEEIVAMQPDLVLAYELSDSQLVRILRQLQFRVEVVPAPQSLASVGQTIETVAGLLGEAEKGRQLVEQMEERLTRLERNAERVPPLAVIYAPNGYSPGTNTLQGSLLEAAGFSNLSRQLGNENGAAIPLELLLRHQPGLFIIDDEESNVNSLAQKKLSHPALRKSLNNAQVARIAGRYWSCPTPQVVRVVERLQEYLF